MTPLTRRQLQTLCLLATAHSAKEVAIIMGCSRKTIEKFRDQVYQKLGIHDNIRLTHYALAHDLVKNLHADGVVRKYKPGK